MLKAHVLRVFLAAIAGMLCGVAYWHFAPKIYSSTAEIFISSSGGQSPASIQLNESLDLGATQTISSEISILQSEGVFREALHRVAQRGDPELYDEKYFLRLYPMYEVGSGGGSRVVQLKVFADTPIVAQSLANTIIDVYNDVRKDAGKSALAGAENNITSQLTQTTTGLQVAESRLRQFKESNHLIDLSATASQIASYQSTLIQGIDSTRADSLAADSEMAQQNKDLSSLPQDFVGGFSEVQPPVVGQLEGQIATYETQRTETLRLYALTSQKIAEIDANIAATQKRLVAARKGAWETTSKSMATDPRRMQILQALVTNQVRKSSDQSRLRSLQDALSVQDSEAAKLPAKEQLLAQFTRDCEVFRADYSRLRAELEDVALKQTSDIKQATTLFAGLADDKPASPQFSKIVPFATIFGGLLGLLLSLGRESTRRTATSGNELAELVELPISAAVPKLPGRKVRARIRSLPEPQHSPMQAFRYLAAAASLGSRLPRLVIFTSVGGGSGCSTAASEFAVAAAKMGTKTLLVDADFRFGTASNTFGHGAAAGLSDMLCRDILASGDSDGLVGTAHTGLSMLAAGTERALFVTDRSKSKLDGVVAFARDNADLVIIDCPPVDVVADTALFLPYADEIYLVVSPNNSSLQAVATARDLIEQGGGKKTSLILTQVNEKDMPFPLRNRYLI